MSEWAKGNTGMIIVFTLCLIFSSVFMFVTKMDRERVSLNIANKHIKTVIAADRSCNDCHLGLSFVNLFNHSAVKGDDNIVLLMMDKSHIKRW